ncbi:MAG: carboxylesterase family protein [Streptosporangiales bacterium]|nr:carboxylesterase family protein [Streptosporangiales bacterium]
MSFTESAPPEVRTSAGTVRGGWEDGLAVFRGIPFAAPPVGGLRFAPPAAPAPWDGVRETTAFGPSPPQSSELAAAFTETGDGDWLSINVWTPNPGLAGLPVMVWIYGGAYLMGYSGDPAYDGAALARDGIVVVSFNYRVGAEGFASFTGAPANRGLLDQVAALEWVRDSIAAFGGDPGRVTVFGESAGAGSIAALLVMPRAAGLFRNAIAQSVPGTYFSPELAADVAAAHAAELGLPPSVRDLRDVAPGALTDATEAIMTTMSGREDRWGPVARTPTPFSPVVDGDVLPCTPWDGLAAGAARDVALIAGHNRDEYRLFVSLAGRLGKVTPEEAESALVMFAPEPAGYRAAFPDAPPGVLYEQVQSDWLFRMPSLRLAEAQAMGGGAAYAYELTWPSPLAGGEFGACHALDIPLTLGNLSSEIAGLLIGEPAPPDAAVLAAHFRAAWTAMAATGDPGWPAYDTVSRTTRTFDVRVTDGPYPEETARRLWEGHRFDALPLLTGARGDGAASLP